MNWQLFVKSPRMAVATVCSIVFVCGLFWQHAGLLGGSAIGLCVSIVAAGDWWKLGKRAAERPVLSSTPEPTDPPAVPPRRRDSNDPNELVREMLGKGRFALLLRPQIVENLTPRQLSRAGDLLDERMGLVPAGPVELTSADTIPDAHDSPRRAQNPRRVVHVEAFYLDRFAVTNEDYQRFVDDGGYEQLALWDEEALPALLDFVDRTGHPGPRFWVEGRCRGEDRPLPVVGISWYEAVAFARWSGRRLPSSAEWTKAGAWPVESSPGQLVQRRYPWGDSFDSGKANIWVSEHNRPVAVDEYADGASIGGVQQLIGNVWEWTASPFGDRHESPLVLASPMKIIRGGAFDTYFENQATCHFASGEEPLTRRQNVGFRLALGVGDVAAQVADEDAAESAGDEDSTSPNESTS